jgi:hypothetical protein
MEFLVFAMLLAFGVHTLKSRDQRRRIALLGSVLGKYQIEKLMESLTEGYLRALGEDDPERRTQIWNLLATTETQLCEQFNRFTAEFSTLDAAQTRVSKLPLALPHADQLFPQATFDLRKALLIHGKGIENAASNPRMLSPRDRAYTMSAELFLMQHTCHWFCRSRTVATARALAQHQTPYAQLVASVAPETRTAYLALTGG